MDYRQNVESKIGDETIFFSVCKPLADKKGLNCPNDAAVCSAKTDQNDAWKVNLNVFNLFYVTVASR